MNVARNEERDWGFFLAHKKLNRESTPIVCIHSLHYRDCFRMSSPSSTGSCAGSAPLAPLPEVPKVVRYYEHWVFMKRNADIDYDIPPTVVASTCNVEDAIDIMIEADFDIYDDEKARILRHMCIGEFYMINDDTCVWKTRSVRRRMIIWDHRQHYDRRMDTDNFMEVWVAYRKYVDYIENCYDNDLRLTEEEKGVLRRQAPYEDLVFPEEHVASAAGVPAPVPAPAPAQVQAARPNVEPIYSAAAESWNGAATRSLGEMPLAATQNLKKRPVCMWHDDDGSVQGEMTLDEEEELVHTFKHARITLASQAEDSEVKVMDSDEEDDL